VPRPRESRHGAPEAPAAYGRARSAPEDFTDTPVTRLDAPVPHVSPRRNPEPTAFRDAGPDDAGLYRESRPRSDDNRTQWPVLDDDPYGFTWAPPRETPPPYEPPSPDEQPHLDPATSFFEPGVAPGARPRTDPAAEATPNGMPRWFDPPEPAPASPDRGRYAESDEDGAATAADQFRSSAWAPGGTTGEIVTGEIVTGDIDTGDVIRAEVIVGKAFVVQPTATRPGDDIVDAELVDVVPAGSAGTTDTRTDEPRAFLTHQIESRPEPSRTDDTNDPATEPHTGRTEQEGPAGADTGRVGESASAPWTDRTVDRSGATETGPMGGRPGGTDRERDEARADAPPAAEVGSALAGPSAEPAPAEQKSPPVGGGSAAGIDAVDEKRLPAGEDGGDGASSQVDDGPGEAETVEIGSNEDGVGVGNDLREPETADPIDAVAPRSPADQGVSTEPADAPAVTTAPAVTDAAATTDAAAAAGRQEGDEQGLGWLLELSGLGATTVDPELDPVAEDELETVDSVADVEATANPAANEPVNPTPASTSPASTSPASTSPASTSPATTSPASTNPVSGAPPAEGWFAPATDPGMTVPDEVLAARSTDIDPAEPQATDDAATKPAAAPATEPTEAAAPTAPETTDPVTGSTETGATESESTESESTESESTESESTESESTEGGATESATSAPEASAGATGGTGLQRREQGDEPERRLVDPELVLATYPWRFDPETLRELVDDPEQLRSVRDRLTDKVEYAERDAVRARLLSLRAVVSRILGDLGRALDDGRAALGHAEATGELRRIAIAKARLAHVLQWRQEFAEADRLFAEADSVELPDRLRAEMHELAGRSAFDQGRHLEAMNHFDEALELRKGQDLEMVARVEVALDAVQSQVRESSWGPYPRSRDAILQRYRAPEPAYDERSGLWGYPGAVLPAFADAQPFGEGVAWIRQPRASMWELINERGELLIDASSGYLGATAFAEGLAWVTRDGAGGWFAIDQRNRLIIPGGFDDVRPFHRGVAPVRRGGWGAIDRHGRMVLPPKYRTFATMLTGGRRVDGFTDEGLAVIDAGDRLGVVDSSGQLLVAPVHAALVIHPVAFLIADRHGHWGALDRNGDPLVDVVHVRESDVTEAIDRLLADTRPVL
jgi:tetratricopeptide (TPR) repeat protein